MRIRMPDVRAITLSSPEQTCVDTIQSQADLSSPLHITATSALPFALHIDFFVIIESQHCRNLQFHRSDS